MEARRIGSLYVVFLVVVLLAGQCTASFDDCYKGCFLSCAISPDNFILLVTSALRSLKDCIFNFSSPGHHSRSMGCAYSSCSHISARDNPRNSLFFIELNFETIHESKENFDAITAKSIN
ncbi:hypothetical protein POPTR_003G056450v4 [Populus trichocarpa]|uniref:Uncharacterized protein n=1 Tax=Populus trichocarpa TaxID=3694 RepID=A0ACC0T8A2_POPTR|nr:hypothetical protein POPTR_003G056450v4 [Populus trichocarpa]